VHPHPGLTLSIYKTFVPSFLIQYLWEINPPFGVFPKSHSGCGTKILGVPSARTDKEKERIKTTQNSSRVNLFITQPFV
jgi:hypothetical protein